MDAFRSTLILAVPIDQLAAGERLHRWMSDRPNLKLIKKTSIQRSIKRIEFTEKFKFYFSQFQLRNHNSLKF